MPDLIVTLLLVMFALAARKAEQVAVESIDTAQQTPQDYTVGRGAIRSADRFCLASNTTATTSALPENHSSFRRPQKTDEQQCGSVVPASSDIVWYSVCADIIAVPTRRVTGVHPQPAQGARSLGPRHLPPKVQHPRGDRVHHHLPQQWHSLEGELVWFHSVGYE